MAIENEKNKLGELNSEDAEIELSSGDCLKITSELVMPIGDMPVSEFRSVKYEEVKYTAGFTSNLSLYGHSGGVLFEILYPIVTPRKLEISINSEILEVVRGNRMTLNFMGELIEYYYIVKIDERTPWQADLHCFEIVKYKYYREE